MFSGRIIAHGMTSVGIALMAASVFTMSMAQGEQASTRPTSNPAPSTLSTPASASNIETPVRVILPAPWETAGEAARASR